MSGVSSQAFRQLIAWAYLPANPVLNTRTNTCLNCTAFFDASAKWDVVYDGPTIPAGRYMFMVSLIPTFSTTYAHVNAGVRVIASPLPGQGPAITIESFATTVGTNYSLLNSLPLAVLLYLLPNQ